MTLTRKIENKEKVDKDMKSYINKQTRVRKWLQSTKERGELSITKVLLTLIH